MSRSSSRRKKAGDSADAMIKPDAKPSSQGGYKRPGGGGRRGYTAGPRNTGIATVGQVFNSVLTSAQLSVQPKPKLYHTGTGRNLGVDIYQDRAFISWPQVIQVAVGSVNHEGVPKTHWFQDSTSTDDSQVDAVLGGFLQNAYSLIVREGASHAGKLFAIRDTTLANSGAFNSFPGWMDNYACAFFILRGLQSCLAGGGINFTMSKIANAVMQSLQRLTADLNRLYTYSMPPRIIQWLDALCGVKFLSTDETVYIAGLVLSPTSTVTLDLTQAGNIGTYLTFAETCLNALQTGTGGEDGISASDSQAIANILSWAYGDPQIPLDKGVSDDAAEYAMQRFQCVTGAGAVSNLSSPNINNTPIFNSVPMMVPKGYSGDLAQFFSLYRTPVYSMDPLVGIAKANTPNQIGLTDNVPTGAATQQTMLGYYNQNGAFLNVALQAGTQLNFDNVELEAVPWAAMVADLLTGWQDDSREFAGYDRVWIAKDWLWEETLFYLEDAFITPVRNGGFNRA